MARSQLFQKLKKNLSQFTALGICTLVNVNGGRNGKSQLEGADGIVTPITATVGILVVHELTNL